MKMLGLVDATLVSVEPVLDTGEFEVRVTQPDSSGQGRLYLYYGNEIVETGRTFYCMKKEGEVLLNHRSGKFSLGKGARAVFRCVFSGQHEDVECSRS